MTQSNPLRVGLIGAGGRWGPRAHVPALKGVPETELYAVCTAHADTAQAAADKFGVTRAYGSDKALNADREVEAVAVAVRVPAHYELTQKRHRSGQARLLRMAARREYQRGRRTGGAGAPEKRAHHGRLAASRVARLSVHARADPARLRRPGAVGEHDADEQRRVDPPLGSHLAARCHAWARTR